MFRRTPSEPLDETLDLVDRTLDLRTQPDVDPFVEEAADRLRRELADLQAFDTWGRPVPWRQVARIALGPLVSPRVRDALTADALEEAIDQAVVAEATRSVSPEAESPVWKAFFRSIDEGDRLLGHEPGALPQR